MRVLVPVLALLVSACSGAGADKAATEGAEGSAEAEMPAGELAELESAISDSTVAEVVADDPAGRLADAAEGPVMADPLATPMPEAAVPVAADEGGAAGAPAAAPGAEAATPAPAGN